MNYTLVDKWKYMAASSRIQKLEVGGRVIEMEVTDQTDYSRGYDSPEEAKEWYNKHGRKLERMFDRKLTLVKKTHIKNLNRYEANTRV